MGGVDAARQQSEANRHVTNIDGNTTVGALSPDPKRSGANQGNAATRAEKERNTADSEMTENGGEPDKKKVKTSARAAEADECANEYGDGSLHYGQHPYGVQPQGNFYEDVYVRGIRPIRNPGLGQLCSLDDATILELLGYVDDAELAALASVSRSLYVFVHHEELWKAKVLCSFDGDFCFDTTWRQTYITMLHDEIDNGSESGPKRTYVKHQPIKVKGFYSDLLFQPFWCASARIHQSWIETENVERRSNLSLEEFIERYETPNKPVIITDVVTNWPAFRKWDEAYLTGVTKDQMFSAGGFQMSFENYFKYAKFADHDDQPLYIFDREFAQKVPQLQKDYEVPVYFNEDLFGLLGDNRPDYRWIIVGPARSGSSFHQDPNATCAWNAVIRGVKKWILYPPEIVPPGVHPSADGANVATPVSLIEWFVNFYGQTRQLAASTGVKPLECIVREGEVIFVPRGWWHTVINLEDSIAITQNYVSARNLPQVLRFLDDRKSQISGVATEEEKERLPDLFKSALRKVDSSALHEILRTYEEQRAQRKQTLWQKVKSPYVTLAGEGSQNSDNKGHIQNEDAAPVTASFSFGFQFDQE